MKSLVEQQLIKPILLIAIIAMLSLVVIPHIWNLNIWITGFFFTSAALRLAIWHNQKRLPSKWLLFLMVILAMVNVFLHVDYTQAKTFGVAMLVVMLGLKLLELRSQRDLYITVFLAFFLIITQFLFDQSMLLTFYLFIPTLGLSAVLHAANRWQTNVDYLYSLKKASLLIISSLPLMLVLYVLFPRLDGPLWSFRLDLARDSVGISDTMEPGSISDLSQSSATAFRVEFKGKMPQRSELYWRGLTLWYSNGRTWEHRISSGKSPSPLTINKNTISYDVIMEASQQQWLFPLDRLINYPRRLKLNQDFELTSNKPITKKYRYTVISATQYQQKPLTVREKALGLQLPNNITQRMQNLVQQWRTPKGEKVATDKQIIQKALLHFNQQPFVYTLKPPKMLANASDQFLFDYQKGFCEHFSSSFVLLMRTAGIPARVVVGYLGGEINPLGGHMVVKQSDAHAWAEVWLDESGWTRVDPTAAVAPERVERPIDVDASQSDAMVTFTIEDTDFTRSVFKQLNWFADNMDLQWHRWVIGYTKNRQKDLLKDMGLDWLSGYKQAMATVISGLVIAGIVALIMLRNRPDKPSPIRASFLKFLNKLRKAGLELPLSLAPTDIARIASKQYPQSSSEIWAIVALYNSLQYGPTQSKAVAKNLRNRVNALKINKTS